MLNKDLLKEISKVILKENSNEEIDRKNKLYKDLKNNHGWKFSSENKLEKDYTIHNKNSDQIEFILDFSNEKYINIATSDGNEVGKVSIDNNSTSVMINLRIEMNIQKYVNK